MDGDPCIAFFPIYIEFGSKNIFILNERHINIQKVDVYFTNLKSELLHIPLEEAAIKQETQIKRRILLLKIIVDSTLNIVRHLLFICSIISVRSYFFNVCTLLFKCSILSVLNNYSLLSLVGLNALVDAQITKF